MADPLTAAERTRLIGILGRLGSDHDGERAAAGLLATQMLRGKGLTWADLLTAPAVAETEPEPETWRETVARCRQHADALSQFEVRFLHAVATFPRLSRKQQAVLDEIAEKVRAAAGRTAA